MWQEDLVYTTQHVQESVSKKAISYLDPQWNPKNPFNAE